MTCDDFRVHFEQQYPENKWSSVEGKIKGVLRRCFEAATVHEPPMGIGHCEQSRAVYAVDLMLSWDDNGAGTFYSTNTYTENHGL
jgi:tubulin--tyrosine ligase-like protein 12